MVESLVFLEGSGGSLKGSGVKKIHAFLYQGKGTEQYVTSNIIESGFRKGQPENQTGRYIDLKEVENLVHKNQKALFQLYRQYIQEKTS